MRHSLAELAADGSMDAAWATALEPVEDDVHRLGDFLRQETA